MQKITGIIAEFNPFHNGHKYLLEQAEGLKIVAMSGNWMQRGEPAIFDKWTRAQMALKNGADIVVELPTLVSVQSADYFAKGSVDILEKMGVNALFFGSENDLDYNRIGQLYSKKSQEIEHFLAGLPDVMSYPEKTQAMWQEILNIKFDGNTPNHVLALAYTKAAAGKPIQLETVKRTNSFHSNELTNEAEQFASATAIRANLADFKSIQSFIPENTHELYKEAAAVSWADLFSNLRYKVISEDLTTIFQMNVEMESRIKEAIKGAENFDDLVERVHTKRYTKARVRRLLTYILLNIEEEYQEAEKVHVLGFSKEGQKHLAGLKGKTIVRIGQEPWDLVTQKADAIYCLANLELKEQNHGRKPIRVGANTEN